MIHEESNYDCFKKSPILLFFIDTKLIFVKHCKYELCNSSIGTCKHYTLIYNEHNCSHKNDHMKRESVLTEKDKESIEIVQFIFHIIILYRS